MLSRSVIIPTKRVNRLQGCRSLIGTAAKLAPSQGPGRTMEQADGIAYSIGTTATNAIQALSFNA